MFEGFACVILVMLMPLLLAASLCCLLFGGAVYGGARAGGQSSSSAGLIALACVCFCCVGCSAFRAWAQARCPNGCKNVFAGPDK